MDTREKSRALFNLMISLVFAAFISLANEVKAQENELDKKEKYCNLMARKLETIKKGRFIPEALYELHNAFESILSRVRKMPEADVVDVIFLLDSTGKTQSLMLLKFLAEIERRIALKFKDTRPDVKLCFPVDTFVCSGSGAIPGALAALGKAPLSEYIHCLESTESAILTSQRSWSFRKFFKNIKNGVKDFASDYFKVNMEVDEDDVFEFEKFSHDSFIMEKCLWQFGDMFSSYSIDDTISDFEIISLNGATSIIDMVFHAISDRNSSLKIQFESDSAIANLNDATDILGAAYSSTQTKKSENAIDLLSKMHFSSTKKKRKRTMEELVSLLNTCKRIKNDIVIVEIKSETARPMSSMEFYPIIPTVAHNEIVANEGLRLINIFYKFAIPQFLYQYCDMTSELIGKCIQSLFPAPNKVKSGAESNAQIVTDLLINSLAEYTSKLMELE
ncbi:hypothetical protein FACS1894113_2620 [Alphaproteobacteria bacterium]|nr:hypothetical protein FACS1894113_2620 [Alphaproteobacteria bacterium]